MKLTLFRVGTDLLLCAAILAGNALFTESAARDAAGAAAVPLRTPASFDGIEDRNARSAALFTEVAKVLTHPRCANCHPVTRTPAQGDDSHQHVPIVFGGPDGRGVPGMPCQNCHKDDNVDTGMESVQSIPGNSHWHLAPASMAWLGRSVTEICEQLKDTERNGNRSLEMIHEHMLKDPLVGWAWDPGTGRQPAPGNQQQFGVLVAAWIETGAACPSEAASRK